MKVLLVGVGGVGESIAVIASKRPWLELMVLADYNKARAEEVQVKLKDKAKFPVEFLDANKQEMIEDLAKKYKVDLIMNACDPSFNGGTTFTNAALVTAINNFPGANARYVDNGYPAWTTEDGTAFRPFDLVAEGVNAAPAGGIVSVVAGSYPRALTINQSVRLEAPVGTVVIGAP